MLGLEIRPALDGHSQRAARGFDLTDPNAAKLGAADAKVAEAESDVGLVGVDLGQEPGGHAVRREGLRHREEVVGVAIIGQFAPRSLARWRRAS